jgi:hypothetical protein
MTDIIVRVASMSGSKKPLTKRRTPIPENITDAGENTCEIGDKGVEEERSA